MILRKCTADNNQDFLLGAHVRAQQAAYVVVARRADSSPSTQAGSGMSVGWPVADSE